MRVYCARHGITLLRLSTLECGKGENNTDKLDNTVIFSREGKSGYCEHYFITLLYQCLPVNFITLL